VVLGVREPAEPVPVIGGLVGLVDYEVGRGGVEQQQVDLQLQQAD
jgi:hypothetical protein